MDELADLTFAQPVMDSIARFKASAAHVAEAYNSGLGCGCPAWDTDEGAHAPQCPIRFVDEAFFTAAGVANTLEQVRNDAETPDEFWDESASRVAEFSVDHLADAICAFSLALVGLARTTAGWELLHQRRMHDLIGGPEGTEEILERFLILDRMGHSFGLPTFMEAVPRMFVAGVNDTELARFGVGAQHFRVSEDVEDDQEMLPHLAVLMFSAVAEKLLDLRYPDIDDEDDEDDLDDFDEDDDVDTAGDETGDTGEHESDEDDEDDEVTFGYLASEGFKYLAGRPNPANRI